MYSPELLDHFEHPRNSGELPGASAQVRVENPACGDILELAANIADDRIVEIRFRAKGCVPAIAWGSALTELAKGRSFGEARRTGSEEIRRLVGGLPPASGHAAELAGDALQALLNRAN